MNTESVHASVQPFGVCNNCRSGMMMLYPDDVLECDTCGHIMTTLVNGNDYKPELMDDEERWLLR